MKNKFFVIVAIIALVGFVATLDYGYVWAQQEDVEPTEPFDEIKYPIQVKFNTAPDLQAVAGGGDINGPKAEQVLVTYVPDRDDDNYPMDDVWYGGEDQVDAIANSGDAYFQKLIDNRANLLVSVRGDTKGKGVWKMWVEDVAGGTHPKARDKAFNNQPDPKVDELEALQLWGGAANRYSEEGDPEYGAPPMKFSVLNQGGTEYVPHGEIVDAVTDLGWNGDGDVDLDALMVWDTSPYGEWSGGDAIIFSIRNTIPGGGNWDGGEIVVLPMGQYASFLNHGGHLWDTAHDVQARLGTDGEDVDAIEAAGTWFTYQTPALTEWGLIILVALLIVSTVFVMLRRKKAVVRA